MSTFLLFATPGLRDRGTHGQHRPHCFRLMSPDIRLIYDAFSAIEDSIRSNSLLKIRPTRSKT